MDSESKVKDQIFKAYDIRGIYSRDIFEETAYLIGNALGNLIGPGKKLALAGDVRVSTIALKKEMETGIVESGANVYDLGVVPTPVIDFCLTEFNFDGGAIVTASHNPREWNGFKLYSEDAHVMGMGTGLEKVKELAQKGAKKYTDKGSVKDFAVETIRSYTAFIVSKAGDLKGLSIGIDPGNGSYSGLAKDILKKSGAEIVSINDFPDGNFPGRTPEPKPESISELKNLVVEEELDLGIAFDADGDRGIFVDDKGKVLRGDMALALMVKNWVKKGDGVVYEVSCSDAVQEAINEKGAKGFISPVGRAFIPEKMMKEKAVLGGEISGHMYFSEARNADDPLFATTRIAHIMSERRKKLSELVAELPNYESFAREIPVEEGIKFRIVEYLKQDLANAGFKISVLDGVKARLDTGWFLIRASNTSPNLRLIAEAKSKEDLDSLVKIATEKLNRAIETVNTH